MTALQDFSSGFDHCGLNCPQTATPTSRYNARILRILLEAVLPIV